MVRALVIAVLLTLAAAAAAAADSIAYVKDGDVFLATPDGGRQAGVTHSGDYTYVSQADDGTMIALAPGERLHRSRAPARCSPTSRPCQRRRAQAGPVTKFHGPFTPEISPDGTMVAFEWFNDCYEDARLLGDRPCRRARSSQRQGVAISHADRLTGPRSSGS